MQAWEKRFVNSRRHSRRVASQAESRLRPIHPRPGDRLLDVGCGNGAAAIHLARTYELDTTGIDTDPDQIHAAAEAANGLADIGFTVGDATTLPFQDREFDRVYCNKTTNHIPDWQRAIGEMARVLKPGCHIVYSDFVAPLGHRLPTRAGVITAATEHGLERLDGSGSPFHSTLVLHKPAGNRLLPSRLRTRASTSASYAGSASQRRED
jgi:ubiquinone/menaquinone biosynthesis C-methylase UbiE